MKKFDKVRCWNEDKKSSEKMLFISKEDDNYPFKAICEEDRQDYENELSFAKNNLGNYFMFQIFVASKERAEQMLNKFKDDLDKIFNNK